METAPNDGDLTPQQVEAQVDNIVAAADRLGVEMNRDQAEEWILAVEEAEHEGAVAQDPQTGVFGHRISLLDFSASELARFRALAQRMRLVRRPNVESAIAIAGSAAQGKIQPFPGDNDFFERVNIKTDTLDEAKGLLRDLMRETALRFIADPEIVLVGVNFGVYPRAATERGRARKQGETIDWAPTDILQGRIVVEDAAGQPLTVEWADALFGTGYCFFSCIVAEQDRGRIVFASNMLDVTWESPVGEITPLDGSLDPFFQEIYLEPEALPFFQKIVRHLNASATQTYIDAMRQQVYHYLHVKPNLGKVSKRLYNLFRLTNRLEEAAFIRTLFDEPGAELYQVPSLLEATEVALGEEQRLGRDTLIRQIDQVVEEVRDAVAGQPEEEILGHLATLKEQVAGKKENTAEWDHAVGEINERCLALVNEFFRVRLYGFPLVADALNQIQA